MMKFLNDNNDDYNGEVILLLFSGGLDSTYLLYKYLTETSFRIHVHHVSIRYPHFDRWKVEDAAANNIIQYCKENYRDFTCSESRYDNANWRFIGLDSDVQLMSAAKVAPNLAGKKITVVRGRCGDDLLEDQNKERDKTAQLNLIWKALCLGVNPEVRDKVNPEPLEPLLQKPTYKKELVQLLPPELLKLCWSCRMPIYDKGEAKACGRCHTCIQHYTILKSLGLMDRYKNLF